MTNESYWNSQSHSLKVSLHRKLHFQYQGAVHCARWMAKAIYSIKMLLFRSQYNFQRQQEVSRRVSSASYGQTVCNRQKSVSICYSSLCEILVSMSIWNRR